VAVLSGKKHHHASSSDTIDVLEYDDVDIGFTATEIPYAPCLINTEG
jgi:hypothetical protein